jgi:hypothetical protein
MTYEEFAALALALPNTHEKVGKIECDLFRDGKHMARLRDKKRAMAIRLPWEMCDQLLATQPDLFFVTPHYDGYPYVLIWLKDLDPELAERLIQAAWSAAPEQIPTKKTPKI